MKKKTKIYFVPHTHWDKEWYFTKEASSVFLVDNILKLKQIANDPESFSHHIYDSQLSIVDDYLEFYPEDFEIIKKLITEKKLIVGPWYSQPDMFSTSGESIIRNLSYGKYFATKLGFSAKEAYTPDSFGFNSNLPQILKHNECDAIIQWRGVDDSHIGKDVFCRWKGIDGSQVYLYNLYKYGYGLTYWAFNSVYKNWNKNNLDELAKEYVTKFKDGSRDDLINLKIRNKSNMLCFPFGSDQSPVIQWLPLFVNKLNQFDDENEWILSDYDTFISDLISQYEGEIQEINGELKYGQYSRTHRTIGSARMDIKKLNKHAEDLLYNISEPLGVLYYRFTGHYPEKIYQKALRFLLESHAHDSLGGSCTDEANSEVLHRLKKAIFMLESQNTLIKKRIVEFLDLQKNDLLIFNLLPYERNVTSEIKVVTKSKEFKILFESKSINYKLLNSTYYDRSNFEISHNSHNKDDSSEKGFYVHKVLLNSGLIKGISYKVLNVYEDEEQLVKGIIRPCIGIDSMENDDYKVFWNGKEIEITNKKSNKKRNIYLESSQDAGDTYDYSPKPKCKIVVKPFNSECFVETSDCFKVLTIKSEYKIPVDLSGKKLFKQKIITKIILDSNEIKMKIDIKNQAKDIRWRVIIDTCQSNKYSYADQALSLVKRPVFETKRMKIWEQQKWKDKPVAIENFSKFVYVKNNDDSVFGVKSNQLNEYELIGKHFDKLAITLFRGVSLIGRRDLEYRPGRASGINDYPHETPESNLTKKLEFELSILDDAEYDATEIYESLSFSDFYQNQNISDYLWIGQTFWRAKVDCVNNKPEPITIFKERPVGLVVSALKISYNKDYLICRVTNLSKNIINLKEILANNDIFQTNGLETDYHTISEYLNPNEIKAIAIKIT